MDGKLVLLFLSSAVLILSSAVSVVPESLADVAELDKNVIAPAYYDGIDLNKLTENEVEELMDAEDEITQGELDIYSYTNTIAKKSHRPKRLIPIIARGVFMAGRALFRQFSRGRVTRSGSRLTRQYNRRGSFQDANRDFQRLNPSNVRNIGNGRLEGRTGTIGNHQVTVRSRSTSGSPTLEIRSPRANGGTNVRKFRYNPQ